MTNNELTPDDVKVMPIGEFAQRFGFQPVDALDKWAWAMQGKRIDQMTRDMMATGVLDAPNLDGIVMEDKVS